MIFKISMVLLVAAIGYLFWPQYNLFEKDGSFSDEYIFTEQTFWNKDDCKKAARKLEYRGICLSTSGFEKIFGKGVEYKQEKEVPH